MMTSLQNHSCNPRKRKHLVWDVDMEEEGEEEGEGEGEGEGERERERERETERITHLVCQFPWRNIQLSPR